MALSFIHCFPREAKLCVSFVETATWRRVVVGRMWCADEFVRWRKKKDGYLRGGDGHEVFRWLRL